MIDRERSSGVLRDMREFAGEVSGKLSILGMALRQLPGYVAGDPRSEEMLNIISDEISRNVDAKPAETRRRIEERVGSSLRRL